MLGGRVMVYIFWNGFLITGTHGKVALVMAPFIIFGIVSGVYMNVKKKERRIFNLIHGLNNLILMILAQNQVDSGRWGYSMFDIGG